MSIYQSSDVFADPNSREKQFSVLRFHITSAHIITESYDH